MPRCWSRDGVYSVNGAERRRGGGSRLMLGLGRRMLDSRAPLVWERMEMGQIVILGIAIRYGGYISLLRWSPRSCVQSGVRLLGATSTKRGGRSVREGLGQLSGWLSRRTKFAI